MNQFASKKNKVSIAKNEGNAIPYCQKAFQMKETVHILASEGNWAELRNLTEDTTIPNGKELQISNMEPPVLMYILLTCFSVLTMISLYILCFSMFTCIAADRYRMFSIGFMLVFSVFVILNTIWMSYAINEIRFNNRWKKYVSIFQHRNMEFIETIAAFTGYKESLLRKDLKSALKKNLISQGHFLNGGRVFSLSEKRGEVTVHTSGNERHNEEKTLSSEISSLQAEYEGRIEISQLTGKVPKTLLNEVIDILWQYCYEIKAHPEIQRDAEALLKSYIDTVDHMLYDGADPLQHQKSLNPDRQQILKNTNAVFLEALTELCYI